MHYQRLVIDASSNDNPFISHMPGKGDTCDHAGSLDILIKTLCRVQGRQRPPRIQCLAHICLLAPRTKARLSFPFRHRSIGTAVVAGRPDSRPGTQRKIHSRFSSFVYGAFLSVGLVDAGNRMLACNGVVPTISIWYRIAFKPDISSWHYLKESVSAISLSDECSIQTSHRAQSVARAFISAFAFSDRSSDSAFWPHAAFDRRPSRTDTWLISKPSPSILQIRSPSNHAPVQPILPGWRHCT